MTQSILALGVLLAVLPPGSSPRTSQSACVDSASTRLWTPITPAALKTRVEPKWPNPAFNDTRGVLVLDVWIDEKGNVACEKVVRSIPLDDQAAIDAVRQWTFTPALINGQPIAVVQEIRLRAPSPSP